METIVILKLFIALFLALAQKYCKLAKLYKIKEIMISIQKKKEARLHSDLYLCQGSEIQRSSDAWAKSWRVLEAKVKSQLEHCLE